MVPGHARRSAAAGADCGALWASGLVAGAAAVVNCLVEQKIDALMARTRGPAVAARDLKSPEALAFAGWSAAPGWWALYSFVNPITMVADARHFRRLRHRLHTVVLKPLTPQNRISVYSSTCRRVYLLPVRDGAAWAARPWRNPRCG